MATLEGQQLGAYQVLQQMGTGGMATVYKAYHARLDRHVAIKVMHEAFQQDAGFLARFEREAQIVARLEHPNIVPVYDFADLNARPYLVMKYIEGTTLKQRLFKKLLSLDEIRRMLPAIADALDYAHRQGILHRDIKPSNILLDKDSNPYLSDFGLARIAQLGESTLSQDVVLGTPQYISPEQAMGRRDLTPQTDLYSFGVVIYETIVGRVPFSSDTPFATIHDHIYRALPAPSSINTALTPAVDAALERALAKRPEDRFENASAMVRAVITALDAANLPALDPDRGAVASEIIDRARHDRPAPITEDDALTTPIPAQHIQFQPETPPQGVEPPIPAPMQSGPPNASEPAIHIPLKGKREFNVRGRKVEAAWDFANVDWKNLGSRIEETIENVSEDIERAIDGTHTTDELAESAQEASIRKRIEQSLKKRNEFVGHLIAYVMVNFGLWMVFGFVSEGDTFPFPLMVMFGWGAGLLAHWVETWHETGARLRQRVELVESAMIREYGYNWSTNASKKQKQAVRRAVEKPIKARIEFQQHLVVYVMIMSLLWTIFGISDGGLFFGIGDAGFSMNDIPVIGDNEFPWPLIPMLAWGFGLIMHGIQTYGASAREREVQRAIERERGITVSGKAKREALPAQSVAVSLDDLIEEDKAKRGARMREDGEFTDSMAQEIRADEQRRRQ